MANQNKDFDLNFNIVTSSFVDALWYHLLTTRDEKILFLFKKMYESKMLSNINDLDKNVISFLNEALKLKLLGYNKDAIFEQLSISEENEWFKRFKTYSENKLDLLDSDIFSKVLEDKIKKFETYIYVSKLFSILLKPLNSDQKLTEIKSQIKDYSAKTDYDVEFKQLKLTEFNKLYENTFNSKFIKINWPSFSKIYENGFESGRLYVIGGASGRGKSAFLTNLGIKFLQQNKIVYHITLENSLLETMNRYVSNISKVPLSELAQNKDKVVKEMNAFLFTNKGQLFIKEYPVYSVSKSDILNYVKTNLVSNNVYPDVIIVDYLDLMSTYDKFNEARFKLTQIANDLKSVSQILNCVVLTATQLNRESLHVITADEYNSSESYGKIQVADSLLTLNAVQEEVKNRLIRLFVAKNRSGPARKEFLFKVNFATMEFSDLDTEVDERYKKALESKNTTQYDFKSDEDISVDGIDL